MPNLTTGGVLLLLLITALALTSGYVFLLEPVLEKRWAINGPPVDPQALSTPFLWPGLERPATTRAAMARLNDDDLVIGIVVAGRCRAYQVKSLEGPTRHVINDLLNEVPITITYCDITQCSRVFTSEARGKPLQIGTGGLLNGKFLLHEQGGFFYQADSRGVAPGQADLPYPVHPHQVTTWKSWREAHPNTDAFTAERRACSAREPVAERAPQLPDVKDELP